MSDSDLLNEINNGTRIDLRPRACLHQIFAVVLLALAVYLQLKRGNKMKCIISDIKKRSMLFLEVELCLLLGV